jgi:WD40 repeat protein
MIESGAAAGSSGTGNEGSAGQSSSKGKKTQQSKNEESKNKEETEEEKLKKKREALESKRPTQYRGREDGFTKQNQHLHWGWVTKIKYYEDLNMLLTSSLDGFIHMHDLETLEYRQKRTFNLH